jgi:hypothetical protein
MNWYYIALNIVISTIISFQVVKYGTKVPDIIKCRRIEVSESVDTRQLVTGYIWVGVPDRYGEQPAVTINAGNDFAGINVTNGREYKSLWLEGK